MKTNSKWLLNLITFLLKAAWYINMVLIVFAFSFLTFKFITSASTEFSTPVKYPLKAETIKMESLTPNAEDITIKADQGILHMKLRNTAGQIITAYTFFILIEVLAMTIIYQLRKFFGTLKEKQPFSPDNVRRLKITALCFALITPLNIALGISTALILNENVKGFNSFYQMVWSESFIGLILGAVIYIMADIFSYGFELQKENGEFV